MEVSWNYELDVVKKYLSEFYSDRAACLREYVANAISAHLRAGVMSPVVVEITKDRIVIEDEGTGIPLKTFKDVFMWFGRSEHRDIPGVNGRFGLGAKSFILLTGNEGKVVMKTRTRDGDESYSAVIDHKGAKILDGGKDEYGTRFEIYPSAPLSDTELVRFYSYVVGRFLFSRVPVHIRVELSANSDVNLIKTGFEELQVSDGTKTVLEAKVGEEKMNLEPVLKTDVFEVYKIGHPRFASKKVVTVGDVFIKEEFWGGSPYFLVRVLQEGAEIELDGVKIKTPSPHPNRDKYEKVDEFVRAVKFYLSLRNFLQNYGRYLNASFKELAELGYFWLNAMRNSIDELIRFDPETKYPYDAPSEHLKRILPGVETLWNRVNALLEVVTIYGLGNQGYGHERTKKPVVELYRVMKDGFKVYYTRTRVSGGEEGLLKKEGITVAYLKDHAMETVFEALGIPKFVRERKKNEKDRMIEKIAVRFGKLDPYDKKYIEVKRVPFVYLDNSLPIFVYVDSIKKLKNRTFPGGVVPFRSNKSTYKMLKEMLGDLLMTYDEMAKKFLDLVLVTDGKEVYSLREVCWEKGKSVTVVLGCPPEIIPLFRKALFNAYALVWPLDRDLDMEPFILGFISEFVRLVRFRSNSSGLPTLKDTFNYDSVRRFLGHRGANLLYILTTQPIDMALERDLMEIMRRYLKDAGLLGKTKEEIWEIAVDKITEQIEKYGILRLGEVPLDAVFYRGPLGKYDGDVKGVAVLNPLILRFIAYGDLPSDGRYYRLKALANLQGAFGLAGALAYSVVYEGYDIREDVREHLSELLVGLAKKSEIKYEVEKKLEILTEYVTELAGVDLLLEVV